MPPDDAIKFTDLLKETKDQRVRQLQEDAAYNMGWRPAGVDPRSGQQVTNPQPVHEYLCEQIAAHLQAHSRGGHIERAAASAREKAREAAENIRVGG